MFDESTGGDFRGMEIDGEANLVLGNQTRLQSIRKIGFTLLALQLLAMAWFSLEIYRRFSLTYDYGVYRQAFYLISKGDLNPFDTILKFDFWRNNGEFILWPLATVGLIFKSGITLLWLQDIFVVASEVVAFSWVCEIVATARWRDRRVPMLLMGTSLVLLLANPWVYWTIAFDFHMETISALLILLVARDISKDRLVRAAVWAGLCCLCGSFSAGLVVGIGLGLVATVKRRRLFGAGLAAVGGVWILALATAGMRGGNLLTAYGYLARNTNQHPRISSSAQLVVGILEHPLRVIRALWERRWNIVANLAPPGLLGLFVGPVAGVALFVTLTNNLVSGLAFSNLSFQYSPMYALMVVGTMAVLMRVSQRSERGRILAVVLAVFFVLDTLGWGLTWIPRTKGQWVTVSPRAASVLGEVLDKTPPTAEVIASQGVIGRFADRRWVYTLHAGSAIPVKSRDVEFIVTPAQGIELLSAIESDRILSRISEFTRYKWLAHRDGVWAIMWHPSREVRSVDLSSSQTSISAWTLAGAAGKDSFNGPVTDWSRISNGHSGYVVAGDYFSEEPGSYVARVKLSSRVPVNVEAWNATGNVLLARATLTPHAPARIVALPVDVRRLYPNVAYSGLGPFRITPIPPAPGNQIELRVWTPGGGRVRVYSLGLSRAR